MKKWLDKYNDDVPQAQNGIEGTMGGLTDKGFNYNGAWGGTMQMGGAMPGAVGFTYARTGSIPSNGPYAKKTKASAQNGKEVEYKELPEIVVVGGKDKPTVDLYRNELDKLDPTSPEGNPYSGGLPYAAYYAKMQMAKEFGVPKIRPAKPVGKVQSFFRNRSGVKSDPNETWPQYSPFTKTVYSGFDNDQEYEKQYIPELSHYLSQKNQGTLDYLKGGISNFLEYAKGNNPYDIKGTEENIAHEQLEPMLREAYDKFWKEGRNKFSEAAGNSMKRKIYERNKKLQNGGEMKFYQEGLDWKPRNISQDGTSVKKPRTDMLTMDEAKKQEEANRFFNAIANQPVVQPALKTGQLSAEEIKRKNKTYAQQTGKKFNENTGAVSSRFSPQQAKTLKKVEENIVDPALMIGDVMGGLALAKPITKALGKKALSTFVDPNRLPNVPRNTRVNTIRQFSNELSQYERSSGIDRDDYRGDLMERFQDIGNRFNIDVSGAGANEQIKNLSKVDKSEFLTSILRSFPQRLRRSDFAPIERSLFTRGGVEITPDEITVPTGLTNRSGLTKQQVLEKAPVKDKDVLSKMTDDQFRETVVKPTGEVVPYYTGDLMPQFTGKQNVMAISADQYANTFNEKIDLLNDIIAKRNKSGVQYKVKKLTPSGQLTFETPAQEGVTGGETYWTANINPGTWEGEVEDIASSTYYKSIPGLSMSSSSAGVFPDRIPRRGTAAYESINEYLKELNLGRVKPGFNSQTEYSRGLWENAVNRGKAFGYYDNPRVVYGSMKSLLPYAGLGGLGAAALEQKREGGEIPVDPMGYWNPDNVGEPVIIPSNEITMEGVYQPLLGISDTGDTQMMYPGEDYEFDGESVTEYPMAQKGKTVPTYVEKFGLNENDLKRAFATKPINNKGDVYYDIDKSGKKFRIHTQSGGLDYIEEISKTLPTVNIKKEPIYVDNPNDPRIRAYQDSLNLYEFVGSKNPSEIKRLKESYYRLKERNKVSPQPIKSSTLGNITFNEAYKKPVQPVKYRKPEPKKEQPKPTPTIVERKQNVYEGSPVYSGTIGSGGPSALVGFANQKGDTTYIKPEDYERFGVPKYGKEFIQNRKKQRNGGVNNADAQPIEKLDQLLNFTNYNKPTKGGWLDKYQ